MDFERRTVLLAGLLTLVSGCARASPEKLRLLGGWDDFKARFMTGDGRIVDTGNGGISHSEGQGFAMVLAEAADDRAAFDRLLAWSEATLALHDVPLFAWRFDPAKKTPVDDLNNATDGDILIAWALLRGSRRWREDSYAERSKHIRDAVRTELVRKRGQRTLLLPGRFGFEHPDRTTINLSYYVWPALDQFRSEDGSEPWDPVIRDGENLLRDSHFGALSLPTDWTDVAPTGVTRPAVDKPPRFGFDAIRIPLYLMLGGRRRDATSIADAWKSFAVRHRPIPAWIDVETGAQADFGLSAGGCEIAERLLGRELPCPMPGPPDYYASGLRLLAQL